jgi:hypothetical protein
MGERLAVRRYPYNRGGKTRLSESRTYASDISEVAIGIRVTVGSAAMLNVTFLLLSCKLLDATLLMFVEFAP